MKNRYNEPKTQLKDLKDKKVLIAFVFFNSYHTRETQMIYRKIKYVLGLKRKKSPSKTEKNTN